MARQKSIPLTNHEVSELISVNEQATKSESVKYDPLLRTAFLWSQLGWGLTPLEASMLRIADTAFSNGSMAIKSNGRTLYAPPPAFSILNRYYEWRCLKGSDKHDFFFEGGSGSQFKVIEVDNKGSNKSPSLRPTEAYGLLKEAMGLASIKESCSVLSLKETHLEGLFKAGASPDEIATYMNMNVIVARRKREIFYSRLSIKERISELYPAL
ncbi:hypothetical protein V6259_12525 [Marinomonas sp. TI.3.20]|uniref:hypothetical protein n=1 Tax=Marinomonas sp. TI.3.20 TaxID=3121296 RepID=UPI00311F692B